MSFLCKHDLPHLLKVHIFHRACDNEEGEGSSSSENSAGEEEAVQVKKGKGLNKIMDLPSVRPDLNEVGPEKSFINFVTGDGVSGNEGHAAIGRQEDRQHAD